MGLGLGLAVILCVFLYVRDDLPTSAIYLQFANRKGDLATQFFTVPPVRFAHVNDSQAPFADVNEQRGAVWRREESG